MQRAVWPTVLTLTCLVASSCARRMQISIMHSRGKPMMTPLGLAPSKSALARLLVKQNMASAFHHPVPWVPFHYQAPLRSCVQCCGTARSSKEASVEPGRSDIAAEKRKIDTNFFKIGAPAFCQFTAEPLARLVDTAYLGRLGPAAFGGAGVAIAAQYSVAKLYNDPLLRSTISIVAAQEGRSTEKRANAVSTALLLALVVGLTQGLCYAVFAAPILTGYNVGPGSPMRAEALNYLRVCAAGAPSATLWLVINGVFRGLGDTATPLLWSCLFVVLNFALDPFFIFTVGMGAAGAAAGTAIAQTIALIPLLIAMHRKLFGKSIKKRYFLSLFRPEGGLEQLRGILKQYMQAGGLVFFRTIGKITAYSVASREAARLGAIAAAAHNLCFQLGVATTQICESLAIATQTLLARELGSQADREADATDGTKNSTVAKTPRAAIVQHIVTRALCFGLFASSALAFLTWVQREGVFASLTTNLEVRDASISLLPWVLLCQVLKGLAYPVNGALMGALDWGASAATMWAAQFSSLGTVMFLSKGGQNALTLVNLWGALAVLFSAQIIVGVLRVLSGTGPWAILRRPVATDGGEETLDDNSEQAASEDEAGHDNRKVDSKR